MNPSCKLLNSRKACHILIVKKKYGHNRHWQAYQVLDNQNLFPHSTPLRPVSSKNILFAAVLCFRAHVFTFRDRNDHGISYCFDLCCFIIIILSQIYVLMSENSHQVVAVCLRMITYLRGRSNLKQVWRTFISRRGECFSVGDSLTVFFF